MSLTTEISWRRLLPNIGTGDGKSLDQRTLYSLAILLVLVQLPHLANLPLWVNATGLLLVGAKLVLQKNPQLKLLSRALSPVSVTLLAAACAYIIQWDYGYLIGRDPCVAFLFILASAKFAEVRRASDATLLLCLCAFLLLTQYFFSQSIITAMVSLPAVLALAYSLSILRDAKHPASVPAQLKMIVILLLQGMPLAAFLFVIFPRLPGPLWSLPEDAMATTGLSDSMSPGSIGQLSQSGAVAFRVNFDDAIPTSDQLYWRGPVLSIYDGRNWQTSSVKLPIKPDYRGSPTELINYTVTLQPHRQAWLFALDTSAALPRSYSADQTYAPPIGQLYHDGQLLAKEKVLKTLRYRHSSAPGYSLPELGSVRSETLHLPGQNLRTISFAKQLRASHQQDSDLANALMQYFNEKPFRYTLQPQLLGDAPVDEFMFDTREGFCEHYAAAFVVTLRAAGIPSRVVTGYQGGEVNDDYLIVRQSDAHAWAESFIDGAWQRFDPTAAVAPSRVEQGLAAALPNESAVPRMARQAPGIVRKLQLRWDALNHDWQRLVIDFDNDSQENLWQRIGFGKPALWQLYLLLLVVAGIWSALILGAPRHSKQKRDVQERLWHTLCRLLETRSLVRGYDESSVRYLRRAADRWPTHESRFERLHDAFTHLRFRTPDEHSKRALLRQLRKDLWVLYIVLPISRDLQASTIRT